MTVATITELKNRLSSYIDRVRAGETVLIVDRGVPVARLEPAVTPADDDGRLARLARAGLVRLGTGEPVPEVLAGKRPRTKSGRSIVDVVLEERRHGR